MTDEIKSELSKTWANYEIQFIVLKLWNKWVFGILCTIYQLSRAK